MFRWSRWAIIGAVFLALFFLDKADFFDAGSALARRLVVTPLTRGFSFAGEESLFFMKNILAVRGVLRENIFLKSERDFFRNEYFKLAGAARENELLRQALNLEKEKGQRLVLGNILAFDPFQTGDYFLIDEGSENGVNVSDPVVLADGIVVGRIKTVYQNESQVLLATSAQSRVAVETEGRRASGIATGSASGSLVLDLVLKEAELKVGQIVLTSGLDNVFPKGLLVGEVSRVDNDSAMSFQKAAVKPFFNLRDLRQVFVLVSLNK